jgi:hypothetical protein
VIGRQVEVGDLSPTSMYNPHTGLHALLAESIIRCIVSRLLVVHQRTGGEVSKEDLDLSRAACEQKESHIVRCVGSETAQSRSGNHVDRPGKGSDNPDGPGLHR